MQSGAYIWLDRRRSGNIWQYIVEINIWNTHQGGFPTGSNPLPVYADSDGVYDVAWKKNYPFSGGSFEAYYFILSGDQQANMLVNVHALFQHLKDTHGLDGGLYVVETSIAAEGDEGAKGKFIADIVLMGRP